MASREENLKKINDALEQLSDEEVEKVAGGYLSELADISAAMTDDIPLGSYIPGVSEFEKQTLTMLLKDKLNRIDSKIRRYKV